MNGETDDRFGNEDLKRVTAAVAFVVTGFIVGALFGQNLAENPERETEQIQVNENVVGV